MSTPPNPLTELAERVELLTDADSITDLNADIYEALGYEVIRGPRNRKGIRWKYRGNGPLYNNERWVSMNWFLRSLDAAMDLKVEGYHILAIHEQPASWIVKIGSRSNDREPIIDVEHDSLIIALCSAWLRARAVSEVSHV
jgi:hypothetical protein